MSSHLIYRYSDNIEIACGALSNSVGITTCVFCVKGVIKKQARTKVLPPFPASHDHDRKTAPRLCCACLLCWFLSFASEKRGSPFFFHTAGYTRADIVTKNRLVHFVAGR